MKRQPGSLRRWPVVGLLAVAFLVWSGYTAMSLHRSVGVRAAVQNRSTDPALVAATQQRNHTWPDRASTRAPEPE